MCVLCGFIVTLFDFNICLIFMRVNVDCLEGQMALKGNNICLFEKGISKKKIKRTCEKLVFISILRNLIFIIDNSFVLVARK